MHIFNTLNFKYFFIFLHLSDLNIRLSILSYKIPIIGTMYLSDRKALLPLKFTIPKT